MRGSNQRKPSKTHTFESTFGRCFREGDNPVGGDWYVVVEDPSQIPQLSQMAGASSTTSRFSDNDTAQILY